MRNDTHRQHLVKQYLCTKPTFDDIKDRFDNLQENTHIGLIVNNPKSKSKIGLVRVIHLMHSDFVTTLLRTSLKTSLRTSLRTSTHNNDIFSIDDVISFDVYKD